MNTTAHAPDLAVGQAAIAEKGFWRAHRYLLLRRLSQLGILLLFLAGPLWGVWWVKGNLTSSMTLGIVPLSDPFVFAQVLATRHVPELSAWIGVVLVVAFYSLAGGRLFCSWVCPVNAVTDSASWLRRRLRIHTGHVPTTLRYWLIPAILCACAITGVTVLEWVNPVTLTHRALIFGSYTALAATLAVFFYDLLVAPRGWCGHLCPVGASYALIGRKSLLRISARHSSRCNDCADCYAVCPEPQVIPIALKGKNNASPVIADANCTLCGRCVDVCAPVVFQYTHRFDNKRV